MYIENTIVARGDWEYIWELSAGIERWVERLPHYRKIVIHQTSKDGLEKRAFMSAWRDILPVNWHTIQRLQPSNQPENARVLYRHVGGVTKGMEVIWKFESLGENYYRITISHDWKPSWPLVGRLAARLISEQIVHDIADKTLACIHELAAVGGTNLAIT